MARFSLGRNSFALLAVTVALAGVLHSSPAQAITLPAKFPRLASYYLNPSITQAQAVELAQWDLVILDAEVQYTHPEALRILRSRNPSIIILAYVRSEDVLTRFHAIADPANPNTKLLSGIADEWRFLDTAGQPESFWPGATMLNVTDLAPVVNGERWNTYLPKFVHNEIMSTGLWDGIFYDNVFQNISWLNHGNIDLDRNGVADNAATADAAWRNGMAKILAASRGLEGINAIILGNGVGQYYESMNGRLVEDFPATVDGGWIGQLESYFKAMRVGFFPAISVVNGISTTGRSTDYKAFRYSFASTLLNYGFFSFDAGSQTHNELWRYDEYHAYLGLPTTAARNLDQPKATTVSTGLWRRDFQNGLVFVNASNRARTITLSDGYVALLGNQQPDINTGQPVHSVTIPARDGRIFLKQVVEIDNGSYINGALQRVFTPRGEAISPGFFSFSQNVVNDAPIIRQDIDGDTLPDRVVMNGNTVSVSNYYGQSLAVFHPFPSARGQLHIAVGDVDGDGRKEIIVGSGRGMTPLVKVFRFNGRELGPSFLVYSTTFRGGVNVAAGDTNGDGRAEIITGAGQGGGPHVKTFTAFGKQLSSFFAYEKNFRGGVSVASGDLNNNGRAEIVVGPGAGRRPFVRIVNAKGSRVLPGFTTFADPYKNGVTVSVSDVNHDNRLDIIASPSSDTISFTTKRSIQALTQTLELLGT